MHADIYHQCIGSAMKMKAIFTLDTVAGVLTPEAPMGDVTSLEAWYWEEALPQKSLYPLTSLESELYIEECTQEP